MSHSRSIIEDKIEQMPELMLRMIVITGSIYDVLMENSHLLEMGHPVSNHQLIVNYIALLAGITFMFAPGITYALGLKSLLSAIVLQCTATLSLLSATVLGSLCSKVYNRHQEMIDRKLNRSYAIDNKEIDVERGIELGCRPS